MHCFIVAQYKGKSSDFTPRCRVISYKIGISNKPTTHYTRIWEETLQAPCWAVVTYLLDRSAFLCFFALFSLRMCIRLREVNRPVLMLLYSAICTQNHCTVAKPKACNQIFFFFFFKPKAAQQTNRSRRSSTSENALWNEMNCSKTVFPDQIKSCIWALWW